MNWAPVVLCWGPTPKARLCPRRKVSLWGPPVRTCISRPRANNRVFVLGAIVAPTATIEAVTDPTASEATLHGTINPNETPPNGIETAWQFEYSTNDVEWTSLPGG